MKPFLPSIIVKTFEGFSDESNLGSCEAKNPYGKKVHKNLENLKVKSKRWKHLNFYDEKDGFNFTSTSQITASLVWKGPKIPVQN